MSVSPFFNFYNNKQEQNLVEDLVNESVNIFGFTGYYIPRNEDQISDLLYGDDPLKTFKTAYPIASYLSNQQDPGMSGEFFSNFGLEIRNNVRINVTKREFYKRIPRETSYDRPKEGDLFYIPHLSGNGELYEIKFCNDSKDYFTLGRKMPYYWELELELFKYNNEDIDTGIDEIDIVNDHDAYAIEYSLFNGTGNYDIHEIVYQGNSLLPTAFGKVQEWNANTHLIRLTNISGEFAANGQIIGSTSNTTYYIQSYDSLENANKEYNAWDNKVIQTISDTIINTDEINPLGTL